MSEFVEFSISSPERFAALQRVFAELKHDKDADNWRSTEDLLSCFDAESLSHFYWPPEDVRRQRLEDLRTRPVIETPTGQAAGRTWDFDSLIDAFMNGEYNLLSCEITEDGQARLNFYALAFPYGGVGCMVALVEAFDCVVTGIEDGTGFVSLNQPTGAPTVDVVEGDLLDQDVDVIVNAQNRNIIPWWLLLPQGVSGAQDMQTGLLTK